jgi:hypothetical protein
MSPSGLPFGFDFSALFYLVPIAWFLFVTVVVLMFLIQLWKLLRLKVQQNQIRLATMRNESNRREESRD